MGHGHEVGFWRQLVGRTAPVGVGERPQLTGFHDLVTISGSFTIGLAVAHKLMPATELWSASRVDEDWQFEQWGEDEEAKLEAELKKSAFLHATELFHAA